MIAKRLNPSGSNVTGECKWIIRNIILVQKLLKAGIYGRASGMIIANGLIIRNKTQFLVADGH